MIIKNENLGGGGEILSTSGLVAEDSNCQITVYFTKKMSN